jgi:hypothetical protein
MHVGKAASPSLPKIANLFKVFGGIKFSSGLGHTHGVKMGNTGEHFRLVTISSDDTATITEYPHDAAVFPMGPAVLVGKFETPQKIVTTILRNLIFNVPFIFCP